MTEAFVVTGGLGVGLLLGVFFFGGLWWTVQKGLTGRHPELWFTASFLLRTAVVAAALYWMARQGTVFLLAGCVGVILARPLVLRVTGLRERRAGEIPP